LRYFPIGSNDHFLLQDLLEASNFELNQKCDSPDENGTFRDTGAIIHINLAYNNVRCNYQMNCSFGVNPITYRYRIYRIPEAEHEIIKLVNINSTYRIRKILHSILVQFDQTGKIGKFSLQVLIINFCSGLGMVATLTVIVDALGYWLLPHFANAKYKFIDHSSRLKNTTSSTSPSSKDEKKEKND